MISNCSKAVVNWRKKCKINIPYCFLLLFNWCTNRWHDRKFKNYLTLFVFFLTLPSATFIFTKICFNLLALKCKNNIKITIFFRLFFTWAWCVTFKSIKISNKKLKKKNQVTLWEALGLSSLSRIFWMAIDNPTRFLT